MHNLKKSGLISALLLAVMSFYCSPSAVADFLLNGYERGGKADLENFVLSIEFVVGDDPIQVNRLGYADIGQAGVREEGLGLLESRDVGIWRVSDQVLVANARVPILDAAVHEDGYRWVELPLPIVLDANETYRIGGQSGVSISDEMENPYGGTFTLGEGIASVGSGSWITGRSALASPQIAFPDTENSFFRPQANMDYGPYTGVENLIPEPGSVILLGSVALLVIRRQRSQR